MPQARRPGCARDLTRPDGLLSVVGLSDWVIRTATEGDIEEVLELWVLAGSSPSVTDNHDGLSRLLRCDDEALLVAVSGSRLIGSLIATFDGWRASFYRLAVHPDHRRLGVASALLRSAEESLLGRGAVRLTAIAVDGDPLAIGFWQAVGYERQQKRARFVKHTHAH